MFITFEGIDGSGKSTQIKLLVEYLTSHGLKVVSLREPGGTDFGEKIRELLLSKEFELSPVTELMLFEAARSHLVANVIKPALSDGNIVVSDRFYDSTTVYQGYGRGLPLEPIMICNRLAADGIVPDITFYLDISVDTSEQRSLAKDKDRIESSGNLFFEKLRHGFNELSEQNPDRFVIIDASGDRMSTHNTIIGRLNLNSIMSGIE